MCIIYLSRFLSTNQEGKRRSGIIVSYLESFPDPLPSIGVDPQYPPGTKETKYR